MQCIIMEKHSNQINHHDETKKRAHDSQIVRAKENLKLSHGGSSYIKASGTNPPIKDFTSEPSKSANKEETIPLNCDWV